jgi:hypothetical protein
MFHGALGRGRKADTDLRRLRVGNRNMEIVEMTIGQVLVRRYGSFLLTIHFLNRQLVGFVVRLRS